MKQTTSVLAALEAGEAGGAEATLRLGDDIGAVAGRRSAGAVGRAVVDDDRPVAVRESGEDAGYRARLVEHGQDDVDGARLVQTAEKPRGRSRAGVPMAPCTRRPDRRAERRRIPARRPRWR